MRPIEPLVLDDITPADLTGLAQPDFDLVDPRDLLVDDVYQRNLSPKSTALIRRIVEGFRWAKFKPPICVRVDGRLHVVDGQHTSVACASHPGITVIPVVVVDEPEAVDRAKAFVSHARDRLAATPGQVWRAEVAAGDEEALTVQQVCNRAGVTLRPFPPAGGTPYAAGETVALSAIKGLITRRGPNQAGDILQALVQADCAPISADLIKAGETLCCADDYKDEFDPERLTAAIKALGPRAHAEAKEIAAAKALPMWRALVAVLFRQRRTRVVSVKPESAVALPLRRVIDRTPAGGAVPMGEPPVGRSALDERRRVEARV